jgi:hypothetical protein
MNDDAGNSLQLDDAMCDRPDGLSPTDARDSVAAKFPRSMNDDVSRRGCFKKPSVPALILKDWCGRLAGVPSGSGRLAIGLREVLRPLASRTPLPFYDSRKGTGDKTAGATGNDLRRHRAGYHEGYMVASRA